MTLKARIKKSIAAHGPMRLDAFISACLWDADEGYYSTRDVFGGKGDFITAPEISQIFGEITALWCISTWQQMGKPARVSLVELGAGRGIWMRDILKAAKIIPDFLDALGLTIIEKSPRRRKEQRENIPHDIRFLEDPSELPQQPSIIISNEFFDALPIRQFRNEDGGWLEAFIDDDLAKIWRPCGHPPKALSAFINISGIIEINQAMLDIAHQLGQHIKANNGAILTIDYGSWDGIGDTLQAVKDHQPTSLFSSPGEADITAHIRFCDLARASGLSPSFTSQGEFLNILGGEARRDALIKKNPTLAQEIRAGYHRLSAPDEMGDLFKVLILEKTS